MPAFPTRPEQIEVIGRADFLDRYWQHKPGEHVTLLGATQSGKTTLAFELLQRSCTPRVPGVVLVMKFRDRTVDEFIKSTGWERVNRLPASPRWMRRISPPRTSGHVVWPKLPGEPEADDELLASVHGHALRHAYRYGDRNIFADEVVGLSELGLKAPLRGLWARGASHGAALWAASQRPAYVNPLAYNGAEHLFLAHERDAQTRKRFDEIGGYDPGVVRAVTRRLRPYHFLYLRKSDRAICIVAP
jgi:hypothetical protein